MNSHHKNMIPINMIPIIERFNDNNIKLFALGGMGEIGKNMYVLECGDEIIIIDAGVMFPDVNYGIDHIVPDYTYLRENQNKIKALFITHGHEDHIGGIPYLLKEMTIPVIYASGIAVHLIKLKTDSFKNITVNIKRFNDKTTVRFVHFTVNFFRTNHSIPDSYGIAVKTRLGYILHTGDFKFDFTPLANHTDYHKLTSYAKAGVLCLLSDSTNALVEEFSVSERKISNSIKSIFRKIKGRIIISTFASNVYRLQQIINACIADNRKVAVCGRAMEKIIKIAMKAGYIDVPASCLLSGDDLKQTEGDRIAVISTGSQGEPLAALSRIADGTHKQIKIRKGDTIIFSSSAIPGNREGINRTINKLYRAGAEVIVNSPFTDTHTSGHGGETELQMMLALTKPEYFVPVHGEYSMQKRHIELATETGVDPDKCFLLENGKVLTFSEKKVFSYYAVPSGNVYVDENNFPVESSVIRERRFLAEDGMVAVIYTINKAGILLKQPNIVTRGFIYLKNKERILKEIRSKAEFFYRFLYKNDEAAYRNIIRRNGYLTSEIGGFIYSRTERRPMIVPVFMTCR